MPCHYIRYIIGINIHGTRDLSVYICLNHFSLEDFHITPFGKRCSKKGAVPQRPTAVLQELEPDTSGHRASILQNTEVADVELPMPEENRKISHSDKENKENLAPFCSSGYTEPATEGVLYASLAGAAGDLLKRGKRYIDICSGINSDNIPMAKKVVVYMLVAINDHWKITVDYFLLDGLSATERENLVRKCLEFVLQCDVIVSCITFDGTASNIGMYHHLGTLLNAEAMKPYFLHPVIE
ncbi:hypothetical protein NQ314_016023 [Rhamnusium bicolor]|uniref:Transposable element P transposase-like RNase H domain-containing protein n=1 Tax=Rhamnusium bicolor TaxID=1586634 RepID=A0AAV8WWX2_9CUCU|nr:hypothetical protein NQ314_016023 [Rhamnusium bicolor]